MHALFLTCGGAWGGSARAFVLAARGLVARGHQVALACESDCALRARAEGEGLVIVPLRSPESATGEGWRLRHVLRERSVDAVFVHTQSELVMAGSAVRFARGRGRVIRRIPPFAAAVSSRRAALAMRVTPTVFLFSTDADREAMTLAKRARVPSVVAPLAVDPAVHDAVRPEARDALGIAEDACLVVCIQDGTRKPQAFTAIRTLALLAPRHPELNLAIVGTGSMDELRMHGAALGVTDRIAFLGAREDELSIIRSADVAWLAADGDSAALAALDCMACGVPVVAERTPLTEYYVADGIAGVLLPADQPAIAASMAAFLSKKEQRDQMGLAGRARLLREFPFDAMIAGYEQAMQR